MSAIKDPTTRPEAVRKPVGRAKVYDRDNLFRIWIWVMAAARVNKVRPFTFCRNAKAMLKLGNDPENIMRQCRDPKNIASRRTLHRRYSQANNEFRYMLQPDAHGRTDSMRLIETLIESEAAALRSLFSANRKKFL
tara:strand:+ start:427 stop:834 length:408 start_codon:yes stop_codon:yes gene_type:complete